MRRARAIDRRVERRGVDFLLKVRVDDSRNGGHALPELLCHPQVGLPVIADGPHVDLGGKSEIEDLGDDIGGLEIECHLRERRRQHFAQPTHILAGRGMALLQRHQNDAVIDADGRAVGECQVVRPRRQPDIVDDQFPFAFGDDLADLVLHRLKDALRGFDPGAGRRPDVELDLTTVDGGKEIAADQQEHRGCERNHQHGDDRDDPLSAEQRGQQPGMTAPQALEAALKAAVNAGKPARGCRHPPDHAARSGAAGQS